MSKYRFLIILLILLSASFSWAKEVPPNTNQLPNESSRFTRIDKTFMSQGDKLGAWLYLPHGIVKPLVIVMAHGFGAQRWMRLPAYAEYFAKKGMAVFLFDYRGFNDSEGTPRNYVNPTRHLQDWEAAIAYVRTLDMVDGKRMALWGTSFSGGHVIVIAAKDKGISAIVSQVPFTDGIKTILSYYKNPIFMIKGTYHGLYDAIKSVFTDKRHNVFITSKPGDGFGMMSRPDSFAGVVRLIGIKDEEEFKPHNFCPANIVFTMMFYRPISYADKVTCPALVIGAGKDTLFPPDGPQKAANLMKKATYVSLPIGHFDPYVDEPFEKTVIIMSDFLKANLDVKSQNKPESIAH
jgi:uncharacterized protein